MTEYEVDVSEPAERDLRGIVSYITGQLSAPLSGRKMMDALEEAIAGLAVMPQRYPFVKDERLASMGYHKAIVKNHIVLFTIDEQLKTVNVERILYARRHWLTIL